jgi:hypothetical protein
MRAIGRLGHAARGHHHEGEVGGVAGHARFRHGGHFRQRGRAAAARDGQRHELAGAHLGQHGRPGEEAAGHLPADHILHRRRRPS